MRAITIGFVALLSGACVDVDIHEGTGGAGDSAGTDGSTGTDASGQDPGESSGSTGSSGGVDAGSESSESSDSSGAPVPVCEIVNDECTCDGVVVNPDECGPCEIDPSDECYCADIEQTAPVDWCDAACPSDVYEACSDECGCNPGAQCVHNYPYENLSNCSELCFANEDCSPSPYDGPAPVCNAGLCWLPCDLQAEVPCPDDRVCFTPGPGNPGAISVCMPQAL